MVVEVRGGGAVHVSGFPVCAAEIDVGYAEAGRSAVAGNILSVECLAGRDSQIKEEGLDFNFLE